MDAVAVQDQHALIAQLAHIRGKVDVLVGDLRTVEGELDGLATERKQHRLLHDLCTSLDELNALGAADLFWGDSAAVVAGEAQVRRVRSRVELFEKRIEELEDQRRGALQQINELQERAGLLEDELFECQEEEERRKQEWIVEREISELHTRPLVMPWTRGGEDDRRFRKSLTTALAICLLFLLLIPLFRLPLHPEKQSKPKSRTVMILEQHRQPPPPPREQPQPPPKVAMQKPVEKPAPKSAPKPETEQPDKAQEPVAPAPQGLLALRDKLDAMKNAEVAPELGAQARINSNDNSAGRPERAMLTSSAPGSSGGINLAALSRNVGGGGGRGMRAGALTHATSNITAVAPGGAHPLSSGPGLARTDEEIQIVFDRYKASLYRLYNRELRKDPTLQGKMNLRLTIEPDGTVSFCAVQSTDLNAPELSAQVVERVKSFNFGAKEVPAVTIVYPIDFLPAA
jgi:outer membrane biosynthesis protein TonB